MNQLIRTLNPVVADQLAMSVAGARVKPAFAQRVIAVFQDTGYKVVTSAPGLSFIQSKESPNQGIAVDARDFNTGTSTTCSLSFQILAS